MELATDADPAMEGEPVVSRPFGRKGRGANHFCGDFRGGKT